MAASVASARVPPATRSLRVRWMDWSASLFAQILMGTLLPALVLAIVWSLARTPLKAFCLSTTAFACAVSSIALFGHKRSPGVEAWVAGTRSCLAGWSWLWVLSTATVEATYFVALLRGLVVDGWIGPDALLALGLLPAMAVIALPSLSTATVFTLWSRQAWRASRNAARARRLACAALGLVLPAALGVAAELAARKAETVVIARYVDSPYAPDPADLAAWRPIARVHGWRRLESLCGYGASAGDAAPAANATQRRARETLVALTGFGASSSSGAGD